MTASFIVPAGLSADRRDPPRPPPQRGGTRRPPKPVRTEGLRFALADGRPLRVCGVTYGPFAPNAAGEPLPEPAAVRHDFARMRAAGVNAVRLYHTPPGWLLDLAEEAGLHLLLDVPCPKHLGFLDSRATVAAARDTVRAAVKAVSGRACLLGTSVGNEIPPDVVRWHGPRRIERFLAELAAAARDADPAGLVTYANYPPTEYLELPFLDFVTFNVYLHDRTAFRNYLHRLLNKTAGRPLVLGELGMDTLRHGDAAQAEFLAGHLAEAAVAGAAGAFVFSWTDDWHTHGHQVEDWAFGLTRRDRTPKPACRAVGEVFGRPPSAQLAARPRVSVIVCSYNGGHTLAQCLESLGRLDYPDYEVILVDDGSTDDTPTIAARFPTVRTVRQPNRGLSAARNVGLKLATGAVVAYTDSDCFADPDWLTRLVGQLQASGAAAVGGPNLSPDDGPVAACVDAAPGQPTHVLVTDHEAEHIPGCNMAYRREVLDALGGFDPVYRKAGDDVDLCWRLLDAGHRIAFAPAAFVWHHRRQTPRAYLRQQAGYGEAEAMLARKHPARFNALGGAVWAGVLYGDGTSGLRLGRPKVFAGRFGQGLFQTLYQPGPAHWALLPATLEWHAAAAAVGPAAAGWPPLAVVAGLMLLLTAAAVAVQAAQARLPARYDGPRARLRVAALCWVQPLVRGWARRRTGWGLGRVELPPRAVDRVRWAAERRYLGCGIDRATLLAAAAETLSRRGWPTAVEDGWTPADLAVKCHSGGRLEVTSGQEFYQAGWSQVVVRFQLRRRAWRWAAEAVAGLAAGLGLAAVVAGSTPAAAGGAVLAALSFGVWRTLVAHARWSATGAVAVFDRQARALGLNPHGAADA